MKNDSPFIPKPHGVGPEIVQRLRYLTMHVVNSDLNLGTSYGTPEHRTKGRPGVAPLTTKIK